MTGKSIKCSCCSKLFANHKSMEQHKASKAASAKQPKQKSQRQKTTKALVALPATVRSANSETATLSGTDIIAQVADISKFAQGELVVSELITPGLFPRLKNVAMAFQKVKYHSLEFRIVPQISSSTSGGYAAAFIADADDTSSPRNITNHLMGQSNCVASKWWQDQTLHVKNLTRTYFTSEGKEPREYVPGIFKLVSTGKSSQSGNLVIYCKWHVTMSVASSEDASNVEEEPTLLVNIYTKSGNQGIGYKVSASEFKWDIQSMISNIGDATAWSLPSPITVGTGESGDGKVPTIRIAHYLVKDGNNLMLGFETPKDTVKYNYPSEMMLGVKGTVLKVAARTQKDLNPKGCSSESPMIDMMSSVCSNMELLTLLSTLIRAHGEASTNASNSLKKQQHIPTSSRRSSTSSSEEFGFHQVEHSGLRENS